MASLTGELGVLIILFICFLFIPQITATMKSSLDTLPMRLAAVIILLGMASYDRYLALGSFLVISAVYIQHHHEDILGVLGTKNNIFSPLSGQKYNSTMQKLEKGGNADEMYDTADFTSKIEDQDNEFKAVDSSIDEKHVLNSEPLGTKAQGLFPDDSKNVNSMEHGNRNGYND